MPNGWTLTRCDAWTPVRAPRCRRRSTPPARTGTHSGAWLRWSVTDCRRGSQAHDEIEGSQDGVRRRTNRAGGIEGGMSTGGMLRLRAAMKPISTVPRALDTVDVRTGEPAKAINQRSDVTAVPAAGVVAEAMVALVLADAAAEKFGGDSVGEARRNLRGYLDSLVIA